MILIPLVALALGQSFYQGTPAPCSLTLVTPQDTIQLSSDSCTWHRMTCGIVCPYEVDLLDPVTILPINSISYQVYPESSAVSFLVVGQDRIRVAHSGVWTFTLPDTITFNGFD